MALLWAAWRPAHTAAAVPVLLALALDGWARTGLWQVGSLFDHHVGDLAGRVWDFRLGTTTPRCTTAVIMAAAPPIAIVIMG